MFKNYDSDVVGFNSSWKTEKNSTDGESQTTEFSTKDSGTSAKVSQSIAVQTEAPEVTVSERPSTPPGLASWLEGIAPMVMKELRLNQRDSIFRNYNPNCDNTAPDPVARLLQTVRAEAPEADTSIPDDSPHNSGGGGDADKIKFPVSALSWSCAGSTLAVARGKLSHDDWCQHEGNIYIFIKSGQTQELKHNAELKMGSCCSAVTFHPSEPALLASASVSGEVCAWNLQRLGEGAPPLLGAPGASPHQAHGARRVSALLWLRDSQRDRFLEGAATNNQILVSCGSDGKVVIWLVNFAASTFVEHRCYEVNTQVGKSMSLPDLSCIDFRKVWSSAVEAIKSDQAEDVFVVGCKTGELFACRVNNATPVAASTNVNPLVFPLEPHGSAVLRVSFTSKAPGFTLLTLGADLEIRTYSLPQTSPLQVLYLDHAVSSVDWLPGSNSLVLAVVGEALRNSAMLQVFDVINGIEVNVDGLDPSGSDSSSEPCGFTSLALNSKSVNTVACGNMIGDVSIWNIPFNNISSSSANRN